MCGIAGFVLKKGPEGDSSRWLREMTRSITHRGPDDEGFFESSTRQGDYVVGMGHRRLSIIDLGSGHQPMANEDGTVQIVFNGEIYNFQDLRSDLISRGHRFATRSDTEVIVHAYDEFGEGCVEHFRGMFAFAIWDVSQEKLFLARDRFGKKPLFIFQNDGVLLFGSELKSLLKFPGLTVSVCSEAVWEYLAYRYVPGPGTLIEGIRKLPPGSVACWQSGKLEETRYYVPPDGFPLQTGSRPRCDPAKVFLEKLEEAVNIRMVSDVPFGAFLSGGIDSSAVVALMTRHSPFPIKTFSVGFDDVGYSELSYARTVAQQFGTDHHELVISSRHLMEMLPSMVKFRDAPVSEPSDIPIYLLSKEASRSVKMVLTGEGSDEMLGGYPKHVVDPYVWYYQRLPALLRTNLIEPLVGALPYKFYRLKTAVANLGINDPTERFPRWFGALSHTERKALSQLADERFETGKGLQFQSDPSNSDLRRILFFDQTSWLPDNLLERGDRMTMAASIEARMPFMDQELVAFVSTLPDRYRVRGTQTKWILRRAMQQVLPAQIMSRDKVGFRVPVNEWFRSSMREYVYDHLTGEGSLTRHYYRRKPLDTILREHVTGRHNHEKTIWSLLNLEIWHRIYLSRS
jgi:asparagine synthase (glutamine-hydrolysing)